MCKYMKSLIALYKNVLFNNVVSKNNFNFSLFQNLFVVGGRLQLFYKPLVVWWVFERAWKCAAMWDGQNAPFFFKRGEKCAVG